MQIVSVAAPFFSDLKVKAASSSDRAKRRLVDRERERDGREAVKMFRQAAEPLLTTVWQTLIGLSDPSIYFDQPMRSRKMRVRPVRTNHNSTKSKLLSNMRKLFTIQ